MKKVIIINGECLGQGSEELGKQLMGSFLRKLTIEEKKPETIIFLNAGVKLLVKGSMAYDAIDLITNAGITIIACGTCINYFSLTEKIEPSLIGDMRGVISAMMNADDVITI